MPFLETGLVEGLKHNILSSGPQKEQNTWACLFKDGFEGRPKGNQPLLGAPLFEDTPVVRSERQTRIGFSCKTASENLPQAIHPPDHSAGSQDLTFYIKESRPKNQCPDYVFLALV